MNISAPRKLGRNSFRISSENRAFVVTKAAGQTSDGKNVRREMKVACKENTPPRLKRSHGTFPGFSGEETVEIEKKRKYFEIIDHHQLLIE
jgi:hypothetical protein